MLTSFFAETNTNLTRAPPDGKYLRMDDTTLINLLDTHVKWLDGSKASNDGHETLLLR